MTADDVWSDMCLHEFHGQVYSCAWRSSRENEATYPSGKRREQAYEGHLVDALALRGDEGRSTLR